LDSKGLGPDSGPIGQGGLTIRLNPLAQLAQTADRLIKRATFGAILSTRWGDDRVAGLHPGDCRLALHSGTLSAAFNRSILSAYFRHFAPNRSHNHASPGDMLFELRNCGRAGRAGN
ncbi:hypothetical protein LCGC14_1502020, partial [marine sediment metagenome]